MTTYRIFPSTSGPSSPVPYSGNFLAGVVFKVTQGGMWFNGYYHWVPASGDTVSRKFALWAITGAGTGSLISAATVTSGTLTAGQWNYIPLVTPVQLAIGTAYNACTGWTAVNGFPDSDATGAGTGAADCFGTGGHTSGITQGPLFAFSDQAGGGGTKPEPFGTAQGVFSTAGTDPAVHMPATGSNSGNFWMDVQVSDAAPAGYTGSYRLWPNNVTANFMTVPDSSVNYVVATEFRLTQECTLNKIWYYSPPGTAQLATSCRIWSVTGPGSGTSVVTNTSPSWSGAAGSGWISCSFTGAVLAPGTYKVSVYNGAATPDGWAAKDANTNYWGTGDGANGITNGPVFAPGLSAPASLAYVFNGSAPGSTPPYTSGTTEAGQATFVNGTGDTYPYLYVDSLAQNYWVDAEVTPVTRVNVDYRGSTFSNVNTGSGTVNVSNTRGGSLSVAANTLSGTAVNANNLGGTVTSVNTRGGTLSVTANTLTGTLNVAANSLSGVTTEDRMQEVDITLNEFNDATVTFQILNNASPMNITGMTVNALFKKTRGDLDNAGTTKTYSSAGGSPAITITNASTGSCSLAIPDADVNSANVWSFYRIDVVSGGAQTTAIYGTVTITTL